MKIVDRQTFLALPEETLFSKYKPSYFEEIAIKGETWGNDFLYQVIVDPIKCHDSGELGDILDDSALNGTSFDLDFDCCGRDGLFDDDQLFAVWEKKDVLALIDRLTQAMTPNA